MDIILVPGLWLDGSSWDDVVPTLEAAGHRAHPLTLPGLESKHADRSGVTLRDHVDAVVREIDTCNEAEQVVVVGHSASCGTAYAAVDARPDRVARAIYIGGFPTPDGSPVAPALPTEDGDMPMPDMSEFDDADLVDLDDAARRAFRDRAIPSPARLATDTLQLSDERRYDVPVTAICPEYTGDQLREWINEGEPSVQEFTKFRDLEYVDVSTGHWPQFTRPEELANAILGTIERH